MKRVHGFCCVALNHMLAPLFGPVHEINLTSSRYSSLLILFTAVFILAAMYNSEGPLC